MFPLRTMARRPNDGQTNPLATIVEEESGETRPYPIRASRRNKPEDYKVVVVEERKSWESKLEYILATVGFTVGFGNIWRFPYLCQKNGGGAFLIPYGVSLMLLGIPLFYLELALGQSLRQGSIGVWNTIHPHLGGVGIASVLVCLLIATYYNMILAWCFYYLFASFQDTLPYSECPTLGNVTSKECESAGRTQYYWYQKALNASDSIELFGHLQWHLCLCLLLAWLAVFLCIMRGLVRSVGKAVYITGTLPCIVLAIFFGRAITLEGSVDGIIHLFKPKFEKLLDPEIWLDAATQVFYSLGIGLGSLIAMSSYNRRHNNCRRDAIFVSVIDTVTSIFASVVVFSVLGFKAHHSLNECRSHYGGLNNTNSNISLEEKCRDLEHWLSLSAQGPGLTFIAFTEAIVKMPISPLWAVLFFSMLVTLGLGSMFGILEGVVTPIYDMKVFTWRKEILTGVIALFSYLVGLLFCQRSGEYWLQMFDLSCGNLPLLFIAFMEIIGVCYIYGASRLEADIEYMLGETPGWYWRITWRFVSPLIVLVIFVASVINMGINKITYTAWNPQMGDTQMVKYPFWGYIVIPVLACISCFCIPIVFCLRCTGLMKYKQKPHRIYLI